MVNAQTWLDENYPKKGACIRETTDKLTNREMGWDNEVWNNIGKKREEITKLDISNQNLAGDLKLERFVNLKFLNCNDNKLTSLKIVNSSKLGILSCGRNELTDLDVSACPKLEKLWCAGNLLTELDLSQNEKLGDLCLYDNNFPAQDLSFLSHLVNLFALQVGNTMHWRERNVSNTYNRFTGSLKPLKNLTQLQALIISHTDIDSGLEYLPFSLIWIGCRTDKRKDAKVERIRVMLEGEHPRVPFKLVERQLIEKWRKDNYELIISAWQEKVTELEEKLQIDREEFEKALEKSQEWRERQLKEILGQKDCEIEKLRVENARLQTENAQLRTQLEKLQLQAQIKVSPK
jgi:hypothetical protein